jgi:TRAP-type C4-dicarboxylate transport system permease small subunit
LARISAYLERGLSVAVVLLAVVFGALVLFQVMARYAFGISIFAASAISNYVFIWFAMLGAALAMKEGLHVAVDVVHWLFPKSLQPAAKALAHVLSLAFACVLVYASISALPAALRNVNPALGISVAWGIAAIPAGAALVAFFTVDALWNGIRGVHGGRGVSEPWSGR